MPLFPESVNLPTLTSDQIRAKITTLHLTDFDVPKILDHIVMTIQKAMSVSEDAQQYISFVLNHPMSKIVAKPALFRVNIIYTESFMMVFQVDDKFIADLNEREILNTFWHTFNFYIQNTYRHTSNSLPECFSFVFTRSYPFTPASEMTIQSDRRLIAAIYSELSFLIYRLEIAISERIKNPLYPVNAVDAKTVNALVQAGGYIPEKFITNCTAEFKENLAKGLAWSIGNMMARPAELIKTAAGDQCYMYLTCGDHKDPICQTIAWAASAIRKCNLFGEKWNVNIFTEFETHLSSLARSLFFKLQSLKINIFSIHPKDLLPNMTETERLNILSNYRSIDIGFRLALSECDAMLYELGPALNSVNSYDPWHQAHQNEVVKWMGPCSNGTVAEIVSQLNTGSISDRSPLYSYGMNALLSFVSGFTMCFVGYAMKKTLETNNPNLSRNITKACQALVSFAAACYSLAGLPTEYKMGFFFINLALFAINEHYKYLTRETAMNAMMAVSSFGLFAVSKSKLELANSVCTSLAGGIAGQLTSELVFGKPKRN